jgi:putative inorganic carbon (hco3(-)) transporter
VKRNSPPPAPEAQSPNGPRQGRRRHSLDFALFILLNATLFVRPHELVPGFGEPPIYNVIILACLAVSSSAVLRQLTPDSLSKNPINACALCLLGSVVLSHLSHFRLGEAFNGAIEFIKVLVYYFLLVSLLDSFSRIRSFLLWLCFYVVVVTSLALLHYYQVVTIPALEAYHERQWEMIDEETGEAPVLARLQATGIYGNPNDLSRILVVGVLLSLYFLGDRRLGLLRPLWILPIALFGQGLHLTQSRGGLLSLFAGLGALFHSRYGRTRTLLLGAVIVPLLLVVGGRQAKLSTSEGTGQQRIKLWIEGFVLLRGSPLFGIGMDQYAEELRLPAHNSFVHSYVELGLVGGTCFFALFYLPCRSLAAESRDQATGFDPELMRLRPFMLAILIATVVGMLSSSRSYSVPTYLIVGLCAAYLSILSDQRRVLMPRFDLNLVGRLLFRSGVTVIALYVYARLSARF